MMMTSTLILGKGGRIMLEGRRMFRIVLSPAIFAITFVGHCLKKEYLKNWVMSNFSRQVFTAGSKMPKLP